MTCPYGGVFRPYLPQSGERAGVRAAGGEVQCRGEGRGSGASSAGRIGTGTLWDHWQSHRYVRRERHLLLARRARLRQRRASGRAIAGVGSGAGGRAPPRRLAVGRRPLRHSAGRDCPSAVVWAAGKRAVLERRAVRLRSLLLDGDGRRGALDVGCLPGHPLRATLFRRGGPLHRVELSGRGLWLPGSIHGYVSATSTTWTSATRSSTVPVGNRAIRHGPSRWPGTGEGASRLSWRTPASSTPRTRVPQAHPRPLAGKETGPSSRATSRSPSWRARGKRAFLTRDWEWLGRLMNDNHEIQRDLGGSGPENEAADCRCAGSRGLGRQAGRGPVKAARSSRCTPDRKSWWTRCEPPRCGVFFGRVPSPVCGSNRSAEDAMMAARRALAGDGGVTLSRNRIQAIWDWPFRYFSQFDGRNLL